MESIVDEISTQNKSSFPRETSRSKSEDEIFGDYFKNGYWSTSMWEKTSTKIKDTASIQITASIHNKHSLSCKLSQ